MSLGWNERILSRRAVGPRDYKQHALQILIKQGIVRVNTDGLVYMVEENLDQDLRRRGEWRLSTGKAIIVETPMRRALTADTERDFVLAIAGLS